MRAQAEAGPPGPVLITGAGGFIGRRALAALKRTGTEVTAIVRPGGTEVEGVATRAVDIADPDAVARVMSEVRPRTVFHLAVDRREDTPAARLESTRTNVLGTAAVLEAAAACGVARLVAAGGSLEYGPVDGPMREDAPLRPVGHYGATKAAATLLCTSRDDLHTVVLRPFLVYGPGQPEDRLIPRVLRAARDGGSISLTREGPARDWVFVDDVVDALVAAAVAAVEPGSVVNVGTGSQWTNHEVVDAARSVTGRPIEVDEVAIDPRPWDRAHWRADTTRLTETLGIRPRSLEEGLAAAWAEMAVAA